MICKSYKIFFLWFFDTLMLYSLGYHKNKNIIPLFLELLPKLFSVFIVAFLGTSSLLLILIFSVSSKFFKDCLNFWKSWDSFLLCNHCQKNFKSFNPFSFIQLSILFSHNLYFLSALYSWVFCFPIIRISFHLYQKLNFATNYCTHKLLILSQTWWREKRTPCYNASYIYNTLFYQTFFIQNYRSLSHKCLIYNPVRKCFNRQTTLLNWFYDNRLNPKT